MSRIIQIGLLISVCLPGRLCAQATTSPTSPPTPPKYYVCSYLLDTEGASDKTKALQADCSSKTLKAKGSAQSHQGTGTKPRGAKQAQTIGFGEIPPSPLDFPFTLTATSSSKLPVTIKVESGPATAAGSTATILRGGTVKLLATQPGDTQFNLTTKELEFFVSDNLDYCVPGLIPPALPKPAGADANAIISALGNPVPFSLQADGAKRILVYSSRLKAHRQPTDTGLQMLTPEDQSTLAQITAAIGQLEGDAKLAAGAGDSSPSSASPSTTPAYSLEVPVPHARSFSGLVATLNGINPDLFTVQGVGSDRIRIKSTKMPSCHEVTRFLQDVRHVAWQEHPESPVAQEYHLASASDFVSAFGGNGGAGGKSGNPGGAGSGNSNGPGSSQSQSRNSNAKQSGPGSGQVGTGGRGASGGAGNTSGASATSTSEASAATGSPRSSDDNGAASASGSQAPSDADNTSAQPNPPVRPAQSNSASVNLISPDLFLFLDGTPGDDSDIAEKKRILAQLDLPRPEVLINVWSMQFSTGDEQDVGKLNTLLNGVVGDYNNGLQEVVSLGFAYLKNQMVQPGYFEPNFYRYVTGRYVGEPDRSNQSVGPSDSGLAVTTSGSDPNQQVSKLPAATPQPDEVAAGMLLMGSAPSLTPDLRAPNGICPADEYCLGYTAIFQPLEPSLMHLLLAIIAAQDPWLQACRAVNYVETASYLADASTKDKYEGCWGYHPSKSSSAPDTDSMNGPNPNPKGPPTEEEIRQEMWQMLRQENCESEDLKRYNEHASSDYRPQMQLECFRQAAGTLLYDPSENTQATGAGLARAAVADFLFNYKAAQQYPHEFSPYDLTLSAQKLDTALNPFNVAFNRDVVAYQKFLRGSIDQCVRSKCPFGDKWGGFENKSFTNDAILTVRTLSATQTSAGVTTQNFLSDTQPASLSDLLGSTVKEGHGGGGVASSAAAPVADLLATSPLPAQLALNALKASQGTEVQIGKSINLKVTPHSLAGASSAELDLTLNVDDAADPTFYTPTQSGNKADVSRVSNHDVSTRVRVDSLKLVDISSFSATLRRSRSRFPLLPIPGFEVPYLGSLVGIPLPAAKEYHSSTAVLSAIVVPTAADLAFGLTFVSDRIVDAGYPGNCYWPGGSSKTGHPCTLRKAVSQADLGNAPLRNFNKAMVSCLATGGWGNTDFEQVPYFQEPRLTLAVKPCTNLSFNTVFQDAE